MEEVPALTFLVNVNKKEAMNTQSDLMNTSFLEERKTNERPMS